MIYLYFYVNKIKKKGDKPVWPVGLPSYSCVNEKSYNYLYSIYQSLPKLFFPESTYPTCIYMSNEK